MDVSTTASYLIARNRILAEEQSMSIEASTFHTMKQNKRSEVSRRLENAIHPREEKAMLSTKEVAEALTRSFGGHS